MTPTITEVLPDIDNRPEWAQEAAERGQLVSECMSRIAKLQGDVAFLQKASNAAIQAERENVKTLREALERAHACATLKDDGTCLGCFVSAALAVTERCACVDTNKHCPPSHHHKGRCCGIAATEAPQ